jgi:hypothetical protein
MPQVTQQWPYGGPGSPYGSFDGKAPVGTGKAYTETFTQLGVHGAIALPYGSFAGKAEAPPVAQAYGPALSRRAISLLLKRRREWLELHGRRLLPADIDRPEEDEEPEKITAVTLAAAPAAAPAAPRYSLEFLQREDELWIELA